MSGLGRSVLVTGGAGFIGSHLCDALLKAGYDVRVLDDLSTGKRANLDRRATLIGGDITDPESLRAATRGVDGIFHLAAVASVARGNEDWPGTHRVNQSGTVMLFDAARDASPGGAPVPVVFASSAAVYGDTRGAIASEDLVPMPSTAYGADKFGCELHARVATEVHGVPTTGLRFFNVYGPRQDPHSPYSGVISIFARRIAEDGTVTLHGDGGQTRDFVHVDDVVAHLLASMRRLVEGGSSGIVNVCTGVPTTIRALAEILASQNGLALTLHSGPLRPGDIRKSCGSPDRARAMLGLRAEIALERGLSGLI